LIYKNKKLSTGIFLSRNITRSLLKLTPKSDDHHWIHLAIMAGIIWMLAMPFTLGVGFRPVQTMINTAKKIRLT
jgi:hypothetical protein